MGRSQQAVIFWIFLPLLVLYLTSTSTGTTIENSTADTTTPTTNTTNHTTPTTNTTNDTTPTTNTMTPTTNTTNVTTMTSTTTSPTTTTTTTSTTTTTITTAPTGTTTTTITTPTITTPTTTTTTTTTTPTKTPTKTTVTNLTTTVTTEVTTTATTSGSSATTSESSTTTSGSSSTTSGPSTTTGGPTDKEIGLIVGLLIAATLIIAFLCFVSVRYWITGSFKKICVFGDRPEYQPQKKPHQPQQPQPVQEDITNYPRSFPIKLNELPDKYIELSSNSGLPFRHQYMMLTRLSPRHPQTAAQHPENHFKNRYTDISPFDHNRVHLNKLEDDEFSDYINASYVPGYRFAKEYITCQGPTEDSVNDHWRMIWEQNVRVIIMVTKCQEGEFIKREKCHQYWPDKDSVPVQYGSITVGLLSSEKYCRDNFKMRKLDVRNGVETRIVYHFQYLRWPDKQNPEDPEGLLEYREAIRDTMMQFEDGPVVVHCSAGVGRSGTYIAVDTLLQRMEDHDTVDIYGLILKLRNYRVYMVQTEGQYMFVHRCLLLAMDNKKKQEVDAGHVYANSVPEEDFNPYENIPLAKRSKDGEQKTLFSSGSRKRKSKVVGSKYIEKDYENIAMIEDKRKSPPPIPTKPESPKEPGQYNKGMTSSREFLYENGNVNDGKNDVKESSENEDSYKGNNPSSEVASDESIVLVEDK